MLLASDSHVRGRNLFARQSERCGVQTFGFIISLNAEDRWIR
jgi:hypothetical protein